MNKKDRKDAQVVMHALYNNKYKINDLKNCSRVLSDSIIHLLSKIREIYLEIHTYHYKHIVGYFNYCIISDRAICFEIESPMAVTLKICQR